ncbi:MAG: MaoC family dehydratase N-terminal domain-containing protein [Roseiarcus sp.]
MVDSRAIGMKLPPVRAHVDARRLRFFLDTIGETNPVYRDREAARAAGFRDIPIPPTFLFCLEMLDSDAPYDLVRRLDIDLARMLHGEQKFVYHAPAVVGDTLLFLSEVANVTRKKGGALTLIDVVTRVVNQDDLPVADALRVMIVRA